MSPAVIDLDTAHRTLRDALLPYAPTIDLTTDRDIDETMVDLAALLSARMRIDTTCLPAVLVALGCALGACD